MNMANTPTPLPDTESARRVDELRRATPGVLRVIHGRANVRYLTGYDGGGAVPWLLVADDACALVHYSADEDSTALLPFELVPYEPGDDPYAMLRDAIAGRTVAADLGWWSVAEARSLGIEPADCSFAIARMRAVKSPWER